jgi:hypothetical protein
MPLGTRYTRPTSGGPAAAPSPVYPVEDTGFT